MIVMHVKLARHLMLSARHGNVVARWRWQLVATAVDDSMIWARNYGYTWGVRPIR